MASKLMKSRELQQGYWDKKLAQRKEILTSQGKSAKDIEKDTVVRSLKAKVRETNARIKAISVKEAKIADMAKMREEKKAAPPKVKGKKAAAEEAAAPKDSKKKAKAGEKKEPKEPKPEKAKKEPKAAPAPEAPKE